MMIPYKGNPDTFRPSSPVPLFLEHAESHVLGADGAFIAATIAVIDGGMRTDRDKVEDMQALLDSYLELTGRQDLGWSRSCITEGDD